MNHDAAIHKIAQRVAVGGALWMAGTEDRTDRRDVDLSGVHVKPLTADDWRELRMVRLAAIEDSPWAFLSDRESEYQWEELDWRRESEAGVWVVARDGGEVVGVARCTPDDEAPESRRYLGAVWVEPEYRRRGIATRLVVWLIRREMLAGVREILVWIVESNDSARRLYQTLGFRPTGDRQLLSGGPGPRTEIRLRLPLTGPRPVA
jgi:ribosomal protein S18 acetylase RimI-like enzyme